MVITDVIDVRYNDILMHLVSVYYQKDLILITKVTMLMLLQTNTDIYWWFR